jgi:hypothetical protein
MFRYNAYFGVHTAYYMDLVSQSGRMGLPMGNVIFAAIKTILARSLAKKNSEPKVLNPWIHGLFNKLDNLKFISYVDADGFPVVLPVIQTQALDSNRVIFAMGAFSQELRKIPAGVRMVVFGMSFSMETVLMRGDFAGIQHVAGIPSGVVTIDWVYNSMPPVPQQVYPPVKVEAVREF